jgi:uncharacterized membrane protein
MKKYSPAVWIIVLIALLPAGYLALIWNRLPETVPVHFGPDMQPDRYGEKAELWLVTLLLAAVSVGVYFLLNNLNRIDPKRKGSHTSSTFNKLGVGLVVFIAALNIIIIESARGAFELQQFMFPLIGVMFAFIGNYMNHIKPNYFAGIRLPWTLSSDENWRRTHQLAGKLWFAGGMLIAIISLFLPIETVLPIFIGIMLVLVAVPIIYSYKLFRQQV